MPQTYRSLVLARRRSDVVSKQWWRRPSDLAVGPGQYSVVVSDESTSSTEVVFETLVVKCRASFVSTLAGTL